jgi:hypothetical protein
MIVMRRREQQDPKFSGNLVVPMVAIEIFLEGLRTLFKAEKKLFDYVTCFLFVPSLIVGGFIVGFSSDFGLPGPVALIVGILAVIAAFAFQYFIWFYTDPKITSGLYSIPVGVIVFTAGGIWWAFFWSFMTFGGIFILARLVHEQRS